MRSRAEQGWSQRDYVRLALTRLEDRVVLDAGAAGVVADINPGVLGSSPAELTPFDGSLYFAATGTNASNQPVGRELYRLDADGSVHLAADINVGAGDSNPASFVQFDGNLLFVATGPQGREIYKLDTAGNVTLFADVKAGTAGSSPESLVPLSNKLFFTADIGAGRELYVANPSGSVLTVGDINPGTASSNPSDFVQFNGDLYFSATGPSIRGLYRVNSQGSSSPNVINLGTGVNDPRGLTAYSGNLYFSAAHPSDGRELFVMYLNSSNKEVVNRIANLDGTSASSSPAGFQVFQNALYFSATTQDGRELFRFVNDGDPENLQFIDADDYWQFDVAPGSDSSNPGTLASFNNTLYFAATVNGQRGLYRINGDNVVALALPAGVTLPTDTVLMPLADAMYFAANGPSGRELYSLNTAGLVSLVADVNPGAGSSDPASVVQFGGNTYFIATAPDVGRELFVLRGHPSSLRVENGVLVFRDEAGDKDNRIVVSSDGMRLHIVDQNGHTIALLTSLTGVTGAGTNEIFVPLASLTGVNALSIDTRGGNDSVTYDLSSNANSLLTQFTTLTYDGGANTDRLRFVGDGALSSTYTPDATITGVGVVIVSGSVSSTFSFRGLEPVDFTGFASAALVAPDTATDVDVLTIANGQDSLFGTADALVVSGTVGGTLIETAFFFGNAIVVVDTAGSSDGDDTVTVASANNNHGNTSLRIDTGGFGTLGSDGVVVNGGVTLAGGFTVETTQLTINAAVTTGGNIALTTLRDVLMSSSGRLTTSGAPVTLLAGGGIVMADGASIVSGSGTIALQATNDITLGRLVTTNTTVAAITVTSLASRVLDGGDSGGANLEANGSGAVVTINAASGVGTSTKALDLSVRQLVVATTNGDQYLNEIDALEQIELTAGTGQISLTAGGAIQDTDAAVDVQASAWNVQATSIGTSAARIQTNIGSLMATVTTGSLFVTEVSGDLRVANVTAPAANATVDILVQTGNLLLGSITASGADSLVVLQAPQGSIRDDNGPTLNITANRADLTAAQGIGIGDALETSLARLTAAGGSGGVFINNSGNLQAGPVSASGANVELTTSGALTVSDPFSTTGSGAILLTAGSDVLVNAALSTSAGAINVNAGRDYIATASGDVSSASGAVTLNAVRNIQLDSGVSIGTLSGPIALLAGGGITMADGALLSSTSGTIALQASGDITLGRLVTDNTTSAAINVTSLAGRVLDGGDTSGANLEANGSGAVVSIIAANGVGTSTKALDIAVRSLVVTTSNSDQFLSELDDLESLNLTAGTGRITLTAGGAIQDSDAAVDVQASAWIAQASSIGTLASPIQTNIGSLAAMISSGSLYLTQVSGDLRVASVNAPGANTTVDILVQSGDLLLDTITASGANSLVVLQTPQGAIRDVNGNLLNLTANRAELSAAQGIGIGDALETSLAQLAASGGSGGVFIHNTGNLVTGLVSATGANIEIFTSGAITIGGSVQTTGGGAINFVAGSDLLVNASISTGNGSVDLNAGRDITATASGDVATTGGAVTWTAARSIVMADGASIVSGSGAIALQATNDITLGRLVTGNTTSAAISVTSLAGSVLDGGDTGGANLEANGAGAVVTINAASGVGTSSNLLDLAVRQLVVATTNSDQFLNELNNLESINLTAGAGMITLTAGGTIQDSDVAVDVQASTWFVQATSIGTSAARIQTNIDALTATVTTGSLFVTETSGDLRVASVTAPGASATVDILVQSGHLLLDTINASGTNSSVVLQTPQGAIHDDNGAAMNLTAFRAEISAAQGIGIGDALETVLAQLTAAGGSGGVFIHNSGNLQAGPVSASGANIEIVTSGAVTVSDPFSTTGSGAIFLTAGSDVFVNARLSTDAGAIDVNAGRDYIATASGDISSTSGAVTLNAVRNIQLGSGVNIGTLSGPITLLAGGAIVMADGASITSGSGTIDVQATGDITLGRLFTTNTTNAAITVASLAGSVLDGGDSGGANLEASGVGAVVTITAASGVGTSAKALDLSVRQLVVATTNSDQYLKEVDSLERIELTAGTGQISLIAGGAIQDTDAAVDVQAFAWIVQATSIGTAAERMQTNIGSLTATVSTGSLFVTEISGDLRVASVTAPGANATVDVLVQTGTLLLDGITAGGTNSVVVLQTPQGAISDDNGSSLNITANRADLSAAQGIGIGDALETSLAQLTAGGGSGGVFISNSGNLQAGPVSASGANIELATSGTLTVSDPFSTTGSGAIRLTAGGDVLVNSVITTGAGAIEVYAGRDYIATASGDVSSTSGAVTLNAVRHIQLDSGVSISTLSGPIALLAGGRIVMADGASIVSASGTIALQASGDITLGRIVTNNTTSAAISVTSLAGQVLDGGDSGGTNLEANGSGAVVTISAANGVGTSTKALDIAVRNLVVTTTNSDQFLNELDDLESINLIAGTGRITLTAGGAIQDSDAAIDVQASAWIVQAASIGTLASPIQTNIGQLSATVTSGSIFVTNSGDLQIGPISAVDGNIELTTGGSLTVTAPVQVTGSGAIALTAGIDMLLNAPLETTSGAITLIAGRDLTASASGDVQSTSGPISLVAARAIWLQSGAEIATLSGSITLLANQGLVPTSGDFTGITLSGATIASTSGDVTLLGRGGTAADNAGIELRQGSIITTSSGDIELSGVSRGTSTGADGIRLADASSVQTLTTGDIAVTGTSGATGHGVLLSQSSGINAFGSGDVLLAGTGGGLADIAWDSLAIAKTGGVYTFQDTVQGGTLVVASGTYEVQFLDGGSISGQVTFQNSGGVTIGDQNSDALTITGGVTSELSVTTLQGTLVTQGDMNFGTTRLVGQVTLVTGGGNLFGGEVQGAGVPLTIDAGGGQVTLTNPANVIGDLTIAAGDVQLVEQDDITQGSAWHTTGTTALTALEHDIVLTHAANTFGPLQLSANNIAIVAAADTDLQTSQWQGTFDVQTAGDLSVTGELQGSGSITLAAQGDVRFTGVGAIDAAALGADVSIFAGDTIFMADGAFTDAGNGPIALQAASDITLGRLVTTNSTSAAISIISLAGQVLDGGQSGGANVEANGAGAVVTISAAGGVGTSLQALDLAVRQLVVTTTNSDQYLNEFDGLERIELTAGTGQIVLTAGGAIQDNDSAVDVQAAAWNVQAKSIGTPAERIQTNIGSLTATVATGSLFVTEISGDLRVAQVTAPTANAVVDIVVQSGDLLLDTITASGVNGLVTLQTPQGAILDINGASPNLTAFRAELSAAQGIGVGDALETSLAQLTASGGSGGVFIDNSGDLEVGLVSATNANLEVTTSGVMTVAAGVQTTASGAIKLAAGSDLLVNAPISAETGSIEVIAGRDLVATASGDVASTSGAVTLTAARSILLGTGVSVGTLDGSIALIAGSGIVMADGASLASGSGPIALQATGDITLGRLVTNNTTSAAINITSLAGRVLDSGSIGGANVEANGAGAVVTITAAGGVGTSTKALDLSVRQLVVTTTNSNQYLNEFDGLEAISLTAGTGRITLTASGAIQDSDAAVDVQATAWNVQATSLGTPVSPIHTSIGTLTATVTSGSLYLTQVSGSGDLRVASVTVPGANAVVSIVVQSGDLLVDAIATGGTLSLISLQTPLGAIRDANGAAFNLTGHRAELAATQGIGVGDALETSLAQLTASGGSGGVFASNSGNLETGLLSASGANIAIATSGTFTVAGAAQTSGSGAILLTAGGDLLLNAPLTTASGAIELFAAHDLRASPAGNITTESGAIRLTPAGGTLAFDGHIALGAGSVTFVIADASSVLRGSISGSGSGGVVKQGLGTLTMTATSLNSYTGTTDLLGGTLRVDGAIGVEQPAQRFTLAASTVLTGSGLVNAPVFSSASSASILPSGNLRLGDGSAAGFDFAGQLLVGAGQLVTLRDANLAQLGLLTRITSGGKLVAAAGVEVGAGESLAGSGAVAGNILVRPGGFVSPGSSPGVLTTDVGDLMLFPNATLIVQVNGTAPGDQYDQINVQGTVSLEGSILSLQGGLFRPAIGVVFTVIVNDSADPIVGFFRDGSGAVLGEGATLRFGGIEADLSYIGGPGGNSVTLTVVDRIKIVQTQSTSTAVGVIGDRAQMQDANFLLARSIAAPIIVADAPPPPVVSAQIETNTASLELRQTDRIRVFFRIVNGATDKDELKQYELDPNVLRDVLGFFKRYKFPDNHYRIYLQEPGKKERLILDVHVVDGRIVPPNFRETEGQGTQPEKKLPQESQPAPQPMLKDETKDEQSRAIDRSAPAFATESWQVRLREALADEHAPLDKVGRMLRSAR